MRGDQTSQGLYCKENNCHETQISARKTAGLLPKPVHFTAKGPIGPLRRFRRPVMTKTTTKPIAATKESASAPLIVLGYDQNHKPRAARFPAKDADLVTKAAQLMDLRVYAAVTEDLAALARSCRRAGCTATAAALCPTSGKACTARSSRRSRSSHRPRSAKTRTSCRSRLAYRGADFQSTSPDQQAASPGRSREYMFDSIRSASAACSMASDWKYSSGPRQRRTARHRAQGA